MSQFLKNLTEAIPQTKLNSNELCYFASKKHWDIFYKRNENRFFKDRHWTTREFWELCLTPEEKGVKSKSVLVEIGCGVGNFAFPLLQDKNCELFIYACDFSPRAIDFVKSHDAYDEEKIGKLRN